MNLGRWDSAVFKSVFLTAFFVLLYAIYEMGFPNDFDSLSGLSMFAILFMGVYLLFSLVGWLLIGFPVHWLICKYSRGSYFWYVTAAVLFFCLLFLVFGVIEVAAIYGFFALIQAVFFKYYAYKQPRT
ncbi:hypothetical protein [Alishewanella jeotgali]|uniref:Uncharacterized protein n=1 Tax=Alishewanella jeotgali KCTC 22429 TaxID=1129374 RepID=H3ZJ53_9ALTE|nr:hypothetical protein [Alishewanella jeotgali]EHR39380.1 hypothetical protein AJE_17095 [Alishewanella jeotgali KCTC 22429]